MSRSKLLSDVVSETMSRSGSRLPAFRMIDTVRSWSAFRLGPLNLELEPGTVMGYVGPNGSGKTTTIHCLTGLLRPDAGSIEIFGRSVDMRDEQWKFDIGHVGERNPMRGKWTGRQNLDYRGRFYPTWDRAWVERLAQRLEVPLDQRVADLSRGNNVKLALLAALGHRPRLLLLDEPTVGLDPVVRSEFLDVLHELVVENEQSLFFSTHILSDIARLVDRIAFLVNGTLLQVSLRDDLEAQWRRISFRADTPLTALRGVVTHVQRDAEQQVISSDGDATLDELRARGATRIEESRLSIEDIAVHILKHHHKGEDHVAHG